MLNKKKTKKTKTRTCSVTTWVGVCLCLSVRRRNCQCEFLRCCWFVGAVRTHNRSGFHRPKTRQLSASNLHWSNHRMKTREWSASSLQQSAIWHWWSRWSRAWHPPYASWRRSQSPSQVRLTRTCLRTLQLPLLLTFQLQQRVKCGRMAAAVRDSSVP